MSTYLFVTKPDYTPERVKFGECDSWSCSSTSRAGDSALVYVAGFGILYEWRILSSAEPSEKWKYICDVEYMQTFEPPISISQIKEITPNDEWAPPYQNFRGLRSITIPADVALRILALRAASPGEDSDTPEESSIGSSLVEGAARQVIETSYERDSEARRRCIAHYGTVCSVCGMDFEKVYGPVAKGFIQVHHLTPLSEIGDEHEVDPIADMRPVCPNCHAVIHLGGALRSIEEVKELLSA